MGTHLRRTWALLVLSLLAILPVAGVVLRGYVADVFPQCRGMLEGAARGAWLRGGDTSTYVPLDSDLGGFSLHLDTVESTTGQVTWAKIVRREVDASGATCECGGVVLRDAGVSNTGGVLWPQPDGTYLYVDNKWHVEGSVLRVSERPTRHLQRDRLVARRQLPAMVVLFAIAALGIAALRARRGILYASKLHAWTEARLEPGGRIESETGETLGIMDGGLPLVPGPVIVSPSTSEQRDIYRELRIVARGSVALGSHAQWREATMRRLRDGRVLAVVSAACSGIALAASLLGG